MYVLLHRHSSPDERRNEYFWIEFLISLSFFSNFEMLDNWWYFTNSKLETKGKSIHYRWKETLWRTKMIHFVVTATGDSFDWKVSMRSRSAIKIGVSHAFPVFEKCVELHISHFASSAVRNLFFSQSESRLYSSTIIDVFHFRWSFCHSYRY